MSRTRRIWRPLGVALALLAVTACQDEMNPAAPDGVGTVIARSPSVPAPTAGISGVSGDPTGDPAANYPSLMLRNVGTPPPSGFSHDYQWGTPYTLMQSPEDGPIVMEGSIDVSGFVDGNVAMIGFVDADALAAGNHSFQLGAYIYIYHKEPGAAWRIGVTDGNDGGEIVQRFVTVPEGDMPSDGILGVIFTVDGTADGSICSDDASTTAAGCMSLQVTGTTGGSSSLPPIEDSYGDLSPSASASPEFSNGAIPGWDDYVGSMAAYDLTVGPIVVTDDQGPVTTNVAMSPNPAAVNASVELTADVDDTNTGGSNIALAEYSVDGGTSWTPMNATDGVFDELMEGVDASFDAPSDPGIYEVCVRGTDEPGNAGAEECSSLVVYDPSGGFVTGGGWIDSPGGAYDGTGGAPGTVRVDTNPDAGWVFNPDPTNATSAMFTADEAQIGSGSLHAGLITNTGPNGNGEKFILAYAPSDAILISDLDAFSIDFLIDDVGSSTSANQFYINAYAVLPGSTSYYDCRFDYVASSGSTSTWTTLGITGSTVATNAGGSSCPATPTLDGMPAGSTVTLVVNMGDTSGNDTGLGAYFDNGQLTLDGSTTTFDFEPGPTPTGKAIFGFVSKYKKGASTPSGNTEFQFKAADLNFHSTSYEWLVVNQDDSNAQFKGEGTINGSGNYKFMLWAGDHDDGDTFRIRITEAGGGVVYDNGTDQVIGGGNILVQSGKGKK